MSKCDICICNPVCDHNRFGWENCNSFKDKSLFVELPCKVGDDIYILDYYDLEIESFFIQSISIRCLKNNYVGFTIHYENERGYSHFGDDCSSYDIGKYAFFTKEEAEAKLKEIGK